jgi:hypothetical protein
VHPHAKNKEILILPKVAFYCICATICSQTIGENKMKSLLTIKNAIIAAVIVVVIIIGYNLVKKPAAAPAPAAKPAISAPVTPAAPAKK